jgi:hypothetical protein
MKADIGATAAKGSKVPHSRHRRVEFNQIMFATAANVRFEPKKTDAARRFNVCFANAFDAQSG